MIENKLKLCSLISHDGYFLYDEILYHILKIILIFDWCHRSLAVVTAVKYKHGIQYVTSVFIFLKNGELMEWRKCT